MILKVKKAPGLWAYFESDVITTRKITKSYDRAAFCDDDVPIGGKYKSVLWMGDPNDATNGVAAYLVGVDFAIAILTEAYLMNNEGKTIERVM